MSRLFTYDKAGNTVLDKHGSGRKDPANDYAYNADGRMSEATSISGGSAAYTYDDFGRQVQIANDTGTLQMAYGLDGALLEETDVASGGALRSYIRLNGRPLAAVNGNGGLDYVLADQLGQPQKLVDATESLVWDRVSGPFGETVSPSTGAETEEPQRFPGQRFDETTALSYNYFRDYDPTLGRYIQSDPIGLAGGLNTYAYVGNNPVNYVDPLGEKGWKAAVEFLKGLPRVGPIVKNIERPVEKALSRAFQTLNRGLDKGYNAAKDAVNKLCRTNQHYVNEALKSDRNGLTKAGRALQKHSS